MVGTVCIVGVLQLVVASGVVASSAVPLPSTIIRQLISEAGTSTFWNEVGQSTQGWAIGLGLATAAGVPLGLLAGASSVVFRSLRFIIDFLRPIPSVAILPLVILVLGVTAAVKISLAGLAAFFPILFATIYGIRDLDPVTLDTARAYRLNAGFRFVFVALPGSAPYVATGLRIAASVALLLTIGTEMIVGLPGLGLGIYNAQYADHVPQMYALIAASGILGMVIGSIFRAVERRLLRWHPSQLRDAA